MKGHLIFYIVCCFLLRCTGIAAQEFIRTGKVTSSNITEISGIVPYSFESGYFWVHNDSGDGPYVYLIDSLGTLHSKVEVRGIKPVDIEDISRVTIEGDTFLLLADIGNNLRNREVLSLYLIKEPHIKMGTKTITVDLLKQFQFKYGDKKRDSEAIFVDPLDNQVYIISKRDFESTVFSFSLSKYKDRSVVEVKPLLNLPFTFTTSADITKDGKHILMKNLSHVYYWQRNPNESIIQTLKKTPEKKPYKIEPQGEAICFDLGDRYYYTISERPFGMDAFIYKYIY